MKHTKMVSLILSAAFVSFSIPFGGVAAAADASDATVLFSDAFEGYTNASDPFSFAVDGYGKYYHTSDLSDSFRLFAGLRGNAASADGYSEESVPKELMQITTASGIGSGNSLMVTGQFQAQAGQLVKKSGITEAAIAGKQLIFKTSFKVPAFVGFADAVSVNLAPISTGVTAPENNTAPHISANTTGKAGELMYLGARNNSTTWGDWYKELNNGTRCNELWTFGEKVADITPGTAYTYTVTMTPNSATGKYDVLTDLNGTKLVLGQGLYPTSSCLPAISDMATYETVRVMRPIHTWYFNVGYRNNGAVAMENVAVDVTDANGKYDNDRAVAYFDDMSLDAVAMESVVFSDDFEGYTENPVNHGKWAKAATNFDRDLLSCQHGEITDFSESDTYNIWINSAPEGVGKVAVIAGDTGIGSGNALKFTGQLGVTNYALAKKSNLDTVAIAGRQLEFSADFKAPSSGVMGEGFGVWVATDTDEATPAIRYISYDTALAKNEAYELKKGEFMFVGSRKTAKSEPTAKGSRATYLYVFGEEVARLNPEAVYNIKVTLTPDGAGYRGAVTLNGRVIALSGESLPTQAEMATYKRLYINPLNHAWTMHDSGAMSSADARPSDMVDNDGYYRMGRTIGIIDNVSLISTVITNAPATDTASDMKAVDKDWTSGGNSFINALATVKGTTAVVEIRSDRTSEISPVIIIAAYDDNNRLTETVINDTTTVPAYGTQTVAITGLPVGYKTLKIFIWENIAGATPATGLWQKDAADIPADDENVPDTDESGWIHLVINADRGILGKAQYLN